MTKTITKKENNIVTINILLLDRKYPCNFFFAIYLTMTIPRIVLGCNEQ